MSNRKTSAPPPPAARLSFEMLESRDVPGSFLSELAGLAGLMPLESSIIGIECLPDAVSLIANNSSEETPVLPAELTWELPNSRSNQIIIQSAPFSAENFAVELYPTSSPFLTTVFIAPQPDFVPSPTTVPAISVNPSPSPAASTSPSSSEQIGFGGSGPSSSLVVGPTLLAVEDWPDTTEDTPVTFDPLANDTAPSGVTPTVTNVGTPLHGTAVLNSNGTITYTPNLNYNGPDSFGYTIGDGQGNSSTAAVKMTVTPVNDAPVAVNDTMAVAEDTEFVLIPVSANDTDVDSDPANRVITDVTQPANGYAFNNNDGTVKYIPNGDFNGADSFTYTINDLEGGSATATVIVTVTPVGDVPVVYDELFNSIGTTVVTEGGEAPAGGGGPFPSIIGNVLSNDINYDTAYFASPYNSGLTITNPRTISNFAYTVNLQSNGAFTVTNITPNTNVTLSVPYTVSNGFGTASAVAYVRISPAYAPTWVAPIANADSFLNDARGDSGNVLTNDSNGAGAYVAQPPVHSRLTWSNAGAFTVLAKPYRTGSGESFRYQIADADKKINFGGGGTGQANGFTIKLTLEADSLDLTDKQRTATTAPKKITITSPADLKDTQKGAAPKAYVHFNVDNDNNLVYLPNSTTVFTPQPNTVAFGYQSVSDFDKLARINGENDLLAVRSEISVDPSWLQAPAIARSGIAKYTRSSADLRAWKDPEKVPQAGNAADSKFLVENSTKSFDLSNLDPAAANGYSAWLAASKVYIEGFGNGKQGQKDATYTFEYTLSDGKAHTVEMKYAFFALNSGRQPSPAERQYEDSSKRFSLIHCVWSITGESTLFNVPNPNYNPNIPEHPQTNPKLIDNPNPVYNCFAWAGGQTNIWITDTVTEYTKAPGGQDFFTINNAPVLCDEWTVLITRKKMIDHYGTSPITHSEVANTDETNAGAVLFAKPQIEFKRYYCPVGQTPTKMSHLIGEIQLTPLNTGKEEITHAARGMNKSTADKNIWIYESKLGQNYRIEHVLDQLRGDAYGTAKFPLK